MHIVSVFKARIFTIIMDQTEAQLSISGSL